MTKLILNDKEFEVISFNRSTYLNDNELVSNASALLVSTEECITNIHSIFDTHITTIKIKKDNEIIYNAGTIDASITVINESLMGEEVNISINIDFH